MLTICIILTGKSPQFNQILNCEIDGLIFVNFSCRWYIIFLFILKLKIGHGKAVDWWTLGILIYEMNAGIDPFSDEDPMGIYQKILKGKIKFPKDFCKNAKSIVKHLVVADLSKRYGNLKKGKNSKNFSLNIKFIIYENI